MGKACVADDGAQSVGMDTLREHLQTALQKKPPSATTLRTWARKEGMPHTLVQQKNNLKSPAYRFDAGAVLAWIKQNKAGSMHLRGGGDHGGGRPRKDRPEGTEAQRHKGTERDDQQQQERETLTDRQLVAAIEAAEKQGLLGMLKLAQTLDTGDIDRTRAIQQIIESRRKRAEQDRQLVPVADLTKAAAMAARRFADRMRRASETLAQRIAQVHGLDGPAQRDVRTTIATELAEAVGTLAEQLGAAYVTGQGVLGFGEQAVGNGQQAEGGGSEEGTEGMEPQSTRSEGHAHS